MPSSTPRVRAFATLAVLSVIPATDASAGLLSGATNLLGGAVKAVTSTVQGVSQAVLDGFLADAISRATAAGLEGESDPDDVRLTTADGEDPYGHIDPTNVPVVTNDFASMTASISPEAANRMRSAEALRTATGSGVVVAVLDSGWNLSHPAIAGRLSSHRFDAVGLDWDVDDAGNSIDDDRDGYADLGVGHGTFVGSLILRVAPGATLVPIRIADDEGYGDEAEVLDGLSFAQTVGVHVVNLSFSAQSRSAAIAQKLRELEAGGIVVICAAGNSGQAEVESIAEARTTFAVGAVDGGDRVASFSNTGSGVDVFAPGVSLTGAYGDPHDRADAIWSGTSFSTGFASGAAALVLQRKRGIQPSSVRSLLRSAVDPAFDASGRPLSGQGRLNLLRVVSK
jgi:subtilisin family serine protease